MVADMVYLRSSYLADSAFDAKRPMNVLVMTGFYAARRYLPLHLWETCVHSKC